VRLSELFASPPRPAVPDTTGLQLQRTVYLYTGPLGVNVRFWLQKRTLGKARGLARRVVSGGIRSYYGRAPCHSGHWMVWPRLAGGLDVRQ
jgi:hypothetical protein